jgi:hypothetical protein
MGKSKERETKFELRNVDDLIPYARFVLYSLLQYFSLHTPKSMVAARARLIINA